MAATTFENFGSGNVPMAAMNMTEMIILMTAADGGDDRDDYF